jgi:hypothetical protein
VTALDQFGDGWGIQSSLNYWIEINGKDSHIYHLNLTDCNQTLIQGCFPGNFQIDHLAYLKFVTIDRQTGLEVIPQYFWEILWRIRVLYQFEEVVEYYGGYDTSMVFQYFATQRKYKLLYSDNLWVFPETAGNSINSCGDIQAGLFNCECRLKPSNCHQFQITATGNVDNDQFYLNDEIYQSIGWYISNNDAADYFNLVDYGIPWSATTITPIQCSVCLVDGHYTFRTTGSYYYYLHAEKANSLWWSFCGQSGSVQTQMEFTILNGVCSMTSIQYLYQLCEGGTCHIYSKNKTLTDSKVVSTISMFTNSPPSSVWLEGGFTKITDIYWTYYSVSN